VIDRSPGIGADAITFSFSPVETIQTGVRVFPAGSFAATDVFTVDQGIRTPYVQVYNLNAQQQLTKNVALEVGYVGSAGRKLFRYRDINQVNPATGTVRFPALVYVNQFESSANSNYNSLQVGPSFRNFDFSVVKNNKLTERVSMQLRMDVFNLFNHPNFANPLWPNFGVDFLQNGMDAAGRGTGFLPITTTPDVGTGNPFLGGGGSRNIQFAARLSF